MLGHPVPAPGMLREAARTRPSLSAPRSAGHRGRAAGRLRLICGQPHSSPSRSSAMNCGSCVRRDAGLARRAVGKDAADVSDSLRQLGRADRGRLGRERRSAYSIWAAAMTFIVAATIACSLDASRPIRQVADFAASTGVGARRTRARGAAFVTLRKSSYRAAADKYVQFLAAPRLSSTKWVRQLRHAGGSAPPEWIDGGIAPHHRTPSRTGVHGDRPRR